MSAITKTFIGASNYAIAKVEETHQTYKVYYRIEKGEYIVTAPESDIPDYSRYYGRFHWNGARVKWVKAHEQHEPT